MKIKDVKYESSYVLTEWNLNNILTDYKLINLPSINIYFDEQVEVTEMREKENIIVLIGYCFDIRDGNKGTNKILSDLLNSDDLEEDLDYINGRYNLIILKNKVTKIFSDASQLKPLVYNKQYRILGSHDSLINMILNEFKIKLEQRSPGFHTELDFTRYKNIFKFNPSLYLKFSNFEFTRFYPRKNLSRQTSKEIFNDMKPYLDQSIAYLEGIEHDKLVTVTAGVDSRVSAALTRDFSNEVEYLTYTQNRNKLASKMAKNIYKIDEKITKDMRSYLGWNHNIINLSDYTASKEQIKKLSKIYNSKHAYSLANYYRERNYNKVIHVKSTVFGMGKADFPKKLDDQEESIEFYRKCVHGLPKQFIENDDVEKEINEYFERNEVHEGVTKGRHYFDLFHLESRMGNWHSMLTLETDPETEEFIFTNCRKIIDFIQAPSTEEKRNYTLYKEIIKSYWPVLLKFGINSTVSESANDQQNINLGKVDSLAIKDVAFKNINKTFFEKKQDTLIVKPDVKLVNIYDTYSFSIEHENMDNKKRQITLTSFYNNNKAKNNINVIIKQNKNIKVLDILEMNNGINITIEKKPIVVSIVYSANFKNHTWVDAGRIQVDLN